MLYDFRVTENENDHSFQLLRHRKSVSHVGLDLSRELSKSGVTEIEEGKTTTYRDDDIGPGLKKVLVDLFDHPLFSCSQADNGALTITNSVREEAQTEIVHGTPYLLSFAPKSHKELELLPAAPNGENSFSLEKRLLIEPTMKIAADFVLTISPSQTNGEGQLNCYQITGEGKFN